MRLRVDSRGFALLDAIVGAVLLGLALAVMLGLTSRAVMSQTRGEHLQVAAMLADERLNLVLALGPDGYAGAIPLRGTCDAPFDHYSYSVEITPQSELDPSLVRIEVRWNEGSRPASIVIETLIARRQGDDPDPERRPEDIVDRNP